MAADLSEQIAKPTAQWVRDITSAISESVQAIVRKPSKSVTARDSTADLPADGAAKRKVEELIKKFKESSMEDKQSLVAALGQDADFHNAVCARLLHPGGGLQDDVVCKWLYELYKSGVPQLQLVLLQFVPALIWTFMNRQRLSEPAAGILACLHVVYQTACDAQAHRKPTGLTITEFAPLPDLSLPSVYHKPNSKPNEATPSGLTESALMKHNNISPADTGFRPPVIGDSPHSPRDHGDDVFTLPQLRNVSSFRSSMSLALVCLSRYNYEISKMNRLSQQQMCLVAAKLADVGVADFRPVSLVEHKLPWRWVWGDEEKGGYKHTLSTPVIEQLLRAVAFCLSTTWAKDSALVGLWQIHSRATQELLPELLLSTTCLIEDQEAQRTQNESFGLLAELR